MSELKLKPATHLVVTRESRTWLVNNQSFLSSFKRCSVDIIGVRGRGWESSKHIIEEVWQATDIVEWEGRWHLWWTEGIERDVWGRVSYWREWLWPC